MRVRNLITPSDKVITKHTDVCSSVANGSKSYSTQHDLVIFLTILIDICLPTARNSTRENKENGFFFFAEHY